MQQNNRPNAPRYGWAAINRTYNTGYMFGNIRGAWLANSPTADRSFKANTLTDNGSVTQEVAESGSEVLSYTDFTNSDAYLYRAFDADLDFGTANFSTMIWFKRTGTSGEQYLWSRKDVSGGGSNIFVSTANAAHTLRCFIGDGSQGADNSGIPYTGSVWNQVVTVWDGTLGTNDVYINGVHMATVTNASVGDLDNSGARLSVGATEDGTLALDQGSLALFRISITNPTATQIRQIYEAEKGMFVANAECLLQSGSTDAVLDVCVDPLSKKILVTQTDAITIFDRLVVDSKPTVNSGASEKGKLWGDLRAEQNSANAYVTAPATDQRQVNEMVRGLTSDLPAGVDLGKAKAWCHWTGSGTPVIAGSYNIKSLTDNGTGNYKFTFGIPFKSADGMAGFGNSQIASNYNIVTFRNQEYKLTSAVVFVNTHAGALIDDVGGSVIFFGELENE